MDGGDDIFDTPRRQCLKLKTEFLRKARNYKFWGRNKSRQRVTALVTVVKYCRQSMKVARYEDKLMDDVLQDIKGFMLEEHILPVPRSVREKLISSVDDDEEEWGTFDIESLVPFITDELEDLRDEALAEVETEEWSNQEEFCQYAFELRSLRKRIYENHNVFFDIQEYEFEVESFLEKYQKILSKKEVGIWKRKVKDTIKFAEGILGYSMSDAEEENKEIVEATKSEESFLENIPTVPAESNEIFDGQSSADLDIENRLMKIKFFRRTWCSSKPKVETEPMKTTPSVEAKVSEPNGNNSPANNVPVYSTKEDAKDFNNWYLCKNKDD